MKTWILLPFYLVLTFSLVGCGPRSTPTTLPEPEIQIEQTSEIYSQSVPQEDPIIVNNCGGAKPEETIRRTSTVSINGEASLGIDYEILEGKLLARYGINQQYEVTYKIEPEKNKKHIIKITWIEDEFKGFIAADGATGKASYVIRIPKYVNADISYFDCRYEHFIQSIEPPIKDERVLEAIRMGVENEDWPLAKMLMADAGYPEGIHVKFLLSRFERLGSSIESAEITILVENLAEVGVWVDVIPKD